jgi:hypothetical protein
MQMNYKFLLPIALLALVGCHGGGNGCEAECGHDFTQKYIDNETAKMKYAEAQAQQERLNILLQGNNEPKTNAVDQYRTYKDNAESLKKKIDKYNSYIDKDRRDCVDAVDVAEGIIYSNMNTSLPSGYTSEGIFVPETINPDVTQSLLANFIPSTAMDTLEGQFIRRMINKYQAYWGENYFFIKRSPEDSSKYLLGMSYIKLADRKFESNPKQSITYLKDAQTILDSLNGGIEY